MNNLLNLKGIPGLRGLPGLPGPPGLKVNQYFVTVPKIFIM